MVYIYTLSHPLTNEIRYVGKTINIKRRYKQHLYDKRKTHKANWVRSLRNDGLKPVLTVIEGCENNWQDRERFWISQFNNLTNFSLGGGVDYIRVTTEETREKIRRANIGKKLTNEHKEKLRSKSNKRKISVLGIVYESIIDAFRKTKIPKSTLYDRVKNDKFNDYFYID
jgi:group I intron endonuclease